MTSLHAWRDRCFTYHIQGSTGQAFSHSLNSLDCLKSNWTDDGNCPAFLYRRCTDHKLLLFDPRSSAVPPYSAHVGSFVRPLCRMEAGTWESLKKKMMLKSLHIRCKSHLNEHYLYRLCELRCKRMHCIYMWIIVTNFPGLMSAHDPQELIRCWWFLSSLRHLWMSMHICHAWKRKVGKTLNPDWETIFRAFSLVKRSFSPRIATSRAHWTALSRWRN